VPGLGRWKDGGVHALPIRDGAHFSWIFRGKWNMEWILRVNTRTGKVTKAKASQEEMHWEDAS